MAAPTIDDLPTEIQLMIIELLAREEIQSLYSTSRLWRSVSEAQYSERFFSTQFVHIEQKSINRLYAISRDRVCHKRVRKVIIIPWQKNALGTDRSAGWLLSPIPISVETNLLLISHVAAVRIAATVRGFVNCKVLSVEGGTKVSRHRKHGDEDVNLEYSDPSLYIHIGHNTVQHKSAMIDFISHLHRNILEVIEGCQRIETLKYFNSGLDFHTFKLDEALCKYTSSFAQSLHLRSLSVKLRKDLLLTGAGMDRLSPLLRLFPNLQTLALKSDDRFGGSLEEFVSRLMSSLPSKLEVLQLKKMGINNATFNALINQCDGTRLKRLILAHCFLHGTAETWETVIDQIQNLRGLHALIFEGCYWPKAGYRPEAGVAYGAFLARVLRVIYQKADNTAHDGLIAAFKSWVWERQTLKDPMNMTVKISVQLSL